MIYLIGFGSVNEMIVRLYDCLHYVDNHTIQSAKRHNPTIYTYNIIETMRNFETLHC